MRRVFATFEDAEQTADAGVALRDANLEPEEPDIDNPFFDPGASLPEARSLRWGGLVGGVIGALLLFALEQNVFWIPRISPIMTAGPYALVFLGFGLGVAIGGFLGGVIGTYRRVPEPARHRLVVSVPDHRVGETRDILRSNGATTVEDTVTYHEHPHRDEVRDASSR